METWQGYDLGYFAPFLCHLFQVYALALKQSPSMVLNSIDPVHYETALPHLHFSSFLEFSHVLHLLIGKNDLTQVMTLF
jgi:hypothetical protein